MIPEPVGDEYNEGPLYRLGQKLYYLRNDYDYEYEYDYVDIVECVVLEIEFKTYTKFTAEGNKHRVERWYVLSDLAGKMRVGPQSRQLIKRDFLDYAEAEKARNEKMLRIREQVWNELEKAQAAMRAIEGKCIEYGIS